MLELEIASLVLLIALSAFFSGTETALMSVSKVRVKTLLKQKKKGAEALFRLKQNPHKLLITILIGNNVVNIAAAAIATIVFTEMFGSSGVGIATGVMTFLVLVFGEITPKTFSAQNSQRISLMVARPIEILSKILSPLVWFFEKISRGIGRLLGSKKDGGMSEEDLRTIVTMGREEGLLSAEAASMMKNVLEFMKTSVVEVMTRKEDMETLDGNKKLRDVLSFVVKSPYSRYPVYVKDEGNVVGILDIDDLLLAAKRGKLGSNVKSIARKVKFVPESKEIDDLLVEFEGKTVPMAIVVDEYGEVSGLVTVEDILEEIVGEIFDKSKRSSIHIKPIKGNLYRVSGKATVEEVNKILHLGIEEGHFNTIAGFIQHKLQRIPKKGEKLELKNVTIEIENASRKRIEVVKISKKS